MLLPKYCMGILFDLLIESPKRMLGRGFDYIFSPQLLLHDARVVSSSWMFYLACFLLLVLGYRKLACFFCNSLLLHFLLGWRMISSMAVIFIAWCAIQWRDRCEVFEVEKFKDRNVRVVYTMRVRRRDKVTVWVKENRYSGSRLIDEQVLFGKDNAPPPWETN